MEWKSHVKWALPAILLLSRAPALAAGGSGPPPVPPPEAVQACSAVQEGAACRFTMGDRVVTGTCVSGPEGQAAACMPPHHPGPPPEAFEACQGLSEGAACSVTFHDMAMTGTCRTGPGGQGALACAPAAKPPRH